MAKREIKAGSRVRPVGFVVLTRKRRGLPPMQAHVPHGWDYTVVEEGPDVPPWDLSTKRIRLDVALAHAEHFEVLPPDKTDEKTAEPGAKPSEV